MVTLENIDLDKYDLSGTVYERLNELVEETIHLVNEKNLPLSLDQKHNFHDNIHYIRYQALQKEGRFKNALTFASQDGNKFLVVSDARSLRKIISEITSDDEFKENKNKCVHILQT